MPPRLAAYWVLGLCLFLSPLSAQAQKYSVPKWEPCSDQALADAFEKSTGQKAWKVLWQKVAYQKSEAEPISTEVAAAWVVSFSGKAGNRVEQGRVGYFWKDGSAKKGWFPGEPFVWKDLKGEPNEGQYPTRYVIASLPEKAAVVGNEDMVERIYNRPVFCDLELPPEECLALLDGVFQSLVKARASKESTPASDGLDAEGKPDFEAVWSISTKERLFSPNNHPGRRFVAFSEGGHGYAVFAFDLKKGEFVLAEVVGAEF
jgi:hypothetical protein